MATDFRSTVCFLCNAPATCKTTASGNCRYFHCSSDSCGHFEISRVAMKRVEGNSRWKMQMSAEAARARIAGKVLRIVVDGPSEIKATLVPRDSVK